MTEPRIFGDRYEIQEPIGEGGMARVYRAHDSRLGRTVALKILREQFTNEREFVERFRLEARLAAGLAHPNIVGVYDVGEDHGLHYMVMEYVEGENLKVLIGREAPMPIEAVIPLMRQLCAALDYAHTHGVVHRDIKPENILITARREVKVGDFGIARALASSGLTTTGTVLGSVSYFSPEQASGQAATGESDLYSAGIVLYEMLTRQVPFSGPNPVTVAMAQVNEVPLSPRLIRPDLPPSVEAVVLKAIAKAPSDRFHSGYELINALTSGSLRGARIASQPTVAAINIANPQPLGQLPVMQRPPRQSNAGALVALITTAVLLLAAVLVARSLSSTSDQAGSTVASPTPQPAASTSLPSASATLPPAPSATVGGAIVVTATPATQAVAPVASNTPGAVVPTSTASLPTAVPTATVAPPTEQPTEVPATSTPHRPRPSETPSGSAGGATIDLVTSTGIGAHFAPAGITSTFAAKASTVYAVAKVHGKPAGASVLFRWKYPDGTTSSYNNTAVTAYAGTVSAYAEMYPRGAGDYSVTTLIKGHVLAEVHFSIAK